MFKYLGQTIVCVFFAFVVMGFAIPAAPLCDCFETYTINIVTMDLIPTCNTDALECDPPTSCSLALVEDKPWPAPDIYSCECGGNDAESFSACCTAFMKIDGAGVLVGVEECAGDLECGMNEECQDPHHTVAAGEGLPLCECQ